MHKNIVSDNLKEWAIALEAAVKEGYSVVKETVAYEAGFWKVLTRKDANVIRQTIAVQVREEQPQITTLPFDTAVELLDNPGEPNEKLKEILTFDSVVEVPEGTKMETSEGIVVAQAVAKSIKRGRK